MLCQVVAPAAQQQRRDVKLAVVHSPLPPSLPPSLPPFSCSQLPRSWSGVSSACLPVCVTLTVASQKRAGAFGGEACPVLKLDGALPRGKAEWAAARVPEALAFARGL